MHSDFPPPREESESLSSAQQADLAFFHRYQNIVPLRPILGQAAFSGFDSHSRRRVLVRAFRLPWEQAGLDSAIDFSQLDSPFAIRVGDLTVRPTETLLVSDWQNSSLEDWAMTEAVSMRDIQRMVRQIGDWMMAWKEITGFEPLIDTNCVRIGRTKVGKPFCRILGGHSGFESTAAVAALRCLVGTVLLWNQQRLRTGGSPDTATRFEADQPMSDLEIDPDSWFGWLLADRMKDRPPSVGDWLISEKTPSHRDQFKRSAHHHPVDPVISPI